MVSTSGLDGDEVEGVVVAELHLGGEHPVIEVEDRRRGAHVGFDGHGVGPGVEFAGDRSNRVPFPRLDGFGGRIGAVEGLVELRDLIAVDEQVDLTPIEDADPRRAGRLCRELDDDVALVTIGDGDGRRGRRSRR